MLAFESTLNKIASRIVQSQQITLNWCKFGEFPVRCLINFNNIKNNIIAVVYSNLPELLGLLMRCGSNVNAVACGSNLVNLLKKRMSADDVDDVVPAACRWKAQYLSQHASLRRFRFSVSHITYLLTYCTYIVKPRLLQLLTCRSYGAGFAWQRASF